jgi:RNA polymerase sigma factor (sigma-70 family)
LRPATDERLVELVRGGDATAFEIVYDRHCRELLTFCRYMLRSQHDAEDAVQLTFASAYSALRSDERSVSLRPWLYAIARNHCLSILRQRRPVSEVDEVAAMRIDSVAQLEQREDLRHALADLIELPENQKTSLILAELHGFSHGEIGEMLGVRAEQVKSYVFQARASLISEREARDADCHAIRRELATARGAGLLKGHLRRHLRSCAGCRDYSDALSRQRRHLGALLPIAPSLALKRRVLRAALGNTSHTSASSGIAATGASAGGAATELTGGAKVLLTKLLAGAVCLGAGTSAATLVVGGIPLIVPASIATSHPKLRLTASTSSLGAVQSARSLAGEVSPSLRPDVRLVSTGGHPAQISGAVVQPRAQATQSGSSGQGYRRNDEVKATGSSEEAHGKGAGAATHGKSEEAHGNGASGGARGKHQGEETHGKSQETHGKGTGGVPHGKSEEAHANASEAARAGGSSEAPHGKSEEVHGGGASKEEAPGNESGEASHGKSEEAHGK